MQTFYLSRNQHGYFRVAFRILLLVSLVRRRVLILRIGSRGLLLRMNDVVIVFLLGGLEALSVANSGVDLVALKEKFEPDRTIVAIDGKTMCDSNKITGAVVLFASVNFVYLWGLQRRAIRTGQAHVVHHALKLKIYATVTSESMFAVK